MDAETKIEVIAQKLEAVGRLFMEHAALSGMCFVLEGFAEELHEVAGAVRGKA